MPQHDMDIDNQTFPATRADINNALVALASASAGPSAPPVMYPGQFWLDTTNNLLRVRNVANTAWLTLFDLGGATAAFTGPIRLATGSAAAPSLAFTDAVSSGLFRTGTAIAFSVAGAQVAYIAESVARFYKQLRGELITSDTQFLAPAGDSLIAPGFAWSGDTDTGIWHPTTGRIGFVTNGGQRAYLTGEDFVFDGVRIRAKDGNAALPGISFLNAGNSGFVKYTGSSFYATVGGEATLLFDGDGVMLFSGKTIRGDGSGLTVLSPSAVGAAIADMGDASVGSYATLYRVSGADMTRGSVYDGSGLRFTGTTGPALSGSWRAVSGIASTSWFCKRV